VCYSPVREGRSREQNEDVEKQVKQKELGDGGKSESRKTRRGEHPLSLCLSEVFFFFVFVLLSVALLPNLSATTDKKPTENHRSIAQGEKRVSVLSAAKKSGLI